MTLTDPDPYRLKQSNVNSCFEYIYIVFSYNYETEIFIKTSMNVIATFYICICW